MKRKLTYTQAVNLLAAYLGTNIMVEKPSSLNYFECKVFRMCKVADMQYEYILIAARPDWVSLLDSIIPLELTENGKRFDYEAIGACGILYQYRYIGKAIRRNRI